MNFFEYETIIESFLKGELTGEEFERQYMDLFNYDKICIGKKYKILSPLFWAVEDYCPYPELRDENDLDENQLAEVAKETLEKIDILKIKNLIKALNKCKDILYYKLFFKKSKESNYSYSILNNQNEEEDCFNISESKDFTFPATAHRLTTDKPSNLSHYKNIR